MENLSSFLCLGGFLFSPVFFFALGFAAGRRLLPYRLIRVDDQEYGVDIEQE